MPMCPVFTSFTSNFNCDKFSERIFFVLLGIYIFCNCWWEHVSLERRSDEWMDTIVLNICHIESRNRSIYLQGFRIHFAQCWLRGQ